MSWLNFMFDAANVALNVSQLQKMNEFSQIQQFGAMTEVIQNLMRDYIFRISQAKEDLLLYLERNPVAVAAGLRYLELELQSSGLKPEFFPQLSDKDYFASTQRSIRHNFMRIYESISDEQSGKIEIAAESLAKVGDLTFLTENYNQATALQNAQYAMRNLEGSKPGLFAFSEQAKWNQQYEQTKREIAHLAQQVDLERFQELVSRYQVTTYEECEEQYNTASEIIVSVFKDVPAPQLQDDITNAAVNSPALDVGVVANDRKECYKCGYLNSKHRVTCKKCRTQLT